MHRDRENCIRAEVEAKHEISYITNRNKCIMATSIVGSASNFPVPANLLPGAHSWKICYGTTVPMKTEERINFDVQYRKEQGGGDYPFFTLE
jgi:hypothetical protein